MGTKAREPFVSGIGMRDVMVITGDGEDLGL